MRLATLLAASGAQVIAIDRRKDLVEQIRDEVDRAVCLDSTDEEALRAQGVENVDVAVVGIGSAFEANALTTVILKQLGVPRVISRATTSIRAQILSRIGSDDTVNPERETAERWAKYLLAPAIMEQIPLAEGYSLVQIAAPKSFYGKSLRDLNVRTKHHVNIVAIRRRPGGPKPEKAGQVDRAPDKSIISVPMPETVIEPEDVLLLVGDNEGISRFPTD